MFEKILNWKLLIAMRRDIPAQYMDSFWHVVMKEGLTVTEYAEIAGVSKSVMSRHLLDIGDYYRSGAPGLGLVTYRLSPHDARAHGVYLTEKGRKLANEARKHAHQYCRHYARGRE
jgi:DNA-binding MarR family transcriptional regulator